jgi:hypothetical protein
VTIFGRSLGPLDDAAEEIRQSCRNSLQEIKAVVVELSDYVQVSSLTNLCPPFQYPKSVVMLTSRWLIMPSENRVVFPMCCTVPQVEIMARTDSSLISHPHKLRIACAITILPLRIQQNRRSISGSRTTGTTVADEHRSPHLVRSS